jgi:hypothetical protein
MEFTRRTRVLGAMAAPWIAGTTRYAQSKAD